MKQSNYFAASKFSSKWEWLPWCSLGSFCWSVNGFRPIQKFHFGSFQIVGISARKKATHFVTCSNEIDEFSSDVK